MVAELVVLWEAIFEAKAFEWRGPAPFLFAAIPDAPIGEVAFAARTASYGWGCIPVVAKIGMTAFTTSLIPRDGGYLVPLKKLVQINENIGPGEEVRLSVRIEAPDQAAASSINSG